MKRFGTSEEIAKAVLFLAFEELVALTNVSGRTLHRDFVDRFGETPGRYIRRIRLLKARAML